MTTKAGKRIRAARAAVDARRVYAVAEAIDAVKGGNGKTKFDETVEAALQLGVDTRKSDQAVRGATVMPAGTGRVVRVAVLAPEEDHEAATAAGADIVGGDDLIAAIRNGEIRFDILIAKPEMMRALAAVGKILGPKGLMPNPKSGTVDANVAAAAKRAKSGQVNFRADKTGIVHAPIGKVSFAAADLLRNLESLLDAVKKARPAASKGMYLRQLTLSSTMGAGVRVDLGAYR